MMVAAGLQDFKLHSYRVMARHMRPYSARMQEEQRGIVRWMESVMAEKGLNPETWAAAAEIAPTSITRAMKDNYPYVTKRQTLQKLAIAAGVEPPVAVGGVVQPQINAANLEPILGVLLPLAPKGRLSDQSLRALSEALAYGLELLGDHLSTPANDDVLKMVVRGVGLRFREINSQ